MSARDELGIAELNWIASAINRSKVLFLLTFLIFFCSLTTLILYLTPVYEGTALLLVNHSGVGQRQQEVRNDLQEDGSLAQIADSEEVLSAAILRVGLSDLNASLEQPSPSKVELLRHWAFPSAYYVKTDLTPLQAALVPIRKSIDVRVEPNSDIIKISFRNRDPAVAALFANAVAQAFIERQLAIFDTPGAADFFKGRKAEFSSEFRRLSDDLTTYAVANSAYSIDDQRQLLLRRQSDLNTALDATRNRLADKKAQLEVLSSELRRLAPVARSSYVSSLVDAIGGPSRLPREADHSVTDERVSDPPLLLVKVYQDTMATLFKTSSEVAGDKSVEADQETQVASVRAQLDALQRHEKHFEELKTAVSQAAYNVEFYTRKMVDEQVRSELAKARFSPVKLLQAATLTTRPVFPSYWLALAFSVVTSLAGAIAAAVIWRSLRDRRAGRLRMRSQLLPSPV